MDKLRKLFSLLCALMALSASAQCRYCVSYEDFMEGRWWSVDSVSVVPISKGHKIMWGGNDYTIKGADKTSCKMLIKRSFAVVADHKLYVNCRNLKCNRKIFGMGFAQAIPLGSHGLMFAAAGSDPSQAAMIGAMLGPVGGAVGVAAGAAAAAAVGGAVAASQLKDKACYIISKGSEGKKYIQVTPVDDKFISKVLFKNLDSLEDYYSETNPSKRLQAGHIFPILEESGLFVPVPEASEETEETN